MNSWKFHGQDMLNFHAYFDSDYSYNEEFDTPDGKHWHARTPIENWTPEMLELAESSGFISKSSQK